MCLILLCHVLVPAVIVRVEHAVCGGFAAAKADPAGCPAQAPVLRASAPALAPTPPTCLTIEDISIAPSTCNPEADLLYQETWDAYWA